AGQIPFVCSFACFLAGRFETIRISVAYTNANVKLVGTHAGIAIGEDGYSQMGLEDVACLRALPNIPIIQPADEYETKQVIAYAPQASGRPGLRRIGRRQEPLRQARTGSGRHRRQRKKVLEPLSAPTRARSAQIERTKYTIPNVIAATPEPSASARWACRKRSASATG